MVRRGSRATWDIFSLLKIGRLDKPSLKVQPVRRRKPHLLHITQFDASQNIGVEIHMGFDGFGLFDVKGHQGAGIVVIGQGGRSLPVFGQGNGG